MVTSNKNCITVHVINCLTSCFRAKNPSMLTQNLETFVRKFSSDDADETQQIWYYSTNMVLQDLQVHVACMKRFY